MQDYSLNKVDDSTRVCYSRRCKTVTVFLIVAVNAVSVCLCVLCFVAALIKALLTALTFTIS